MSGKRRKGAAGRRRGGRKRDRPAPPGTLPFEARLELGGEEGTVRGTVPAGSVPFRALLPLLEGADEMVVGLSARKAVKAGKAISCRKGCGACCRQGVPVSREEVRRIAALVAALPPGRRKAIRERFAAGAARLREAGALPPRWVSTPGFSPEAARAFGLQYFAVGVPCPFLEEESCGIHPERPLACREYLVTSPAERCADPAAGGIETVPVPGRLSSILSRWDGTGIGKTARWYPLVLALEVEEEDPAPPPGPVPAPETLSAFLEALAEAIRAAKGEAAGGGGEPPPEAVEV